MFKKYHWLHAIFQRKRGKDTVSQVTQQASHALTVERISAAALKVIHRLCQKGFAAYLVGGGVRDMLLDAFPKDFDIVTNARPYEVRKIFPNSRIIGRRFRLVHVYFPEEVIEVSTFRAYVAGTRALVSTGEQRSEERTAILSENNTYGTIEEDVWRRDFTVNALYYDIQEHKVIDFTDGLSDLKRRVIRMIGDPAQRFHEDPVRILRAIRLATKLGFSIESATNTALLASHHLLAYVPQARLFTELLKIFFKGHASQSYPLLYSTGYLEVFFPQLVAVLHDVQDMGYEPLIQLALKKTDRRYHVNESLNPGFLFAVFLWPVVQVSVKGTENKRLFSALHHSVRKVVKKQSVALPLPKRLLEMMHAIWILQYHLERRRPARIHHIMAQRYFRAAFDFLTLRAEIDPNLKEVVAWWRHLSEHQGGRARHRRRPSTEGCRTRAE